MISLSDPKRRPTGARKRQSHAVPIVVSAVVVALAIAVISYLLWPTWTVEETDGATQLPISIGKTLFAVPAESVRMKVQRHSGPQERIDLSFAYPSLAPGDAPKHPTTETLSAPPSIDVIFLTIADAANTTPPEERARTIYPRYLEATEASVGDGLTMRAFRDNTPYTNEDLFAATSPDLLARCTRDAKTPGMCLVERRLEGADLTFRFPRSWLAQWRNVADAMDRITGEIYKPRS